MIKFEVDQDFQTGAFILLNKPYKWTSFDLVNKVKFKLKHKFDFKKIKVGHAGTLDPLATGLMIVCTGKYTKQIDTYQAQVKEYIATLKLGSTTPSFDLETEIDETFPTEHIDSALIDETLKGFLGEIRQRPPAYSAIKIDGKRAYESARKGEAVKLKVREVEIKIFEIDDANFPEISFRIVCSKGTYIRTMANDFGKLLGSGAYLSSLRRTKIGEFSVDDAEDVVVVADKMRKIRESL